MMASGPRKATYLEAVVDVQQVVGVRACVQHQLFRQRSHPPVCQLVLLISLHTGNHFPTQFEKFEAYRQGMPSCGPTNLGDDAAVFGPELGSLLWRARSSLTKRPYSKDSAQPSQPQLSTAGTTCGQAYSPAQHRTAQPSPAQHSEA